MFSGQITRFIAIGAAAIAIAGGAYGIVTATASKRMSRSSWIFVTAVPV